MESIRVVLEEMPWLLKGALLTVEIAFISLIIATFIGLVFGLMRVSNSLILRSIARVYVSVIRGTPLYVQLIFFYFGLMPFVLQTSIEPILAGGIVLSLNAGAYLVEIFRAGIESIDKGQMEAGRAIGFSSGQTMRFIILPQAIKRMVPAFLNQFIISLKDTSLLATIGITELTYSAQTIYAMNFKAFEFLAAIGIMYWIMITGLGWLVGKIERRLTA